MSGLSPIDSNYNYYKAQINDLEDELDKSLKRAEQRYEDRTDSLKEKYDTIREKDQKSMDETVRNVKERASEAELLEHENANREIDRLKNITYDRNGRTVSEADVMKSQLEDQQRAYEKALEKHRMDIDDLNKAHEKKMEEQHVGSNEKLDKAVTDTKGAILTSKHLAHLDDSHEFDDMKKDTRVRLDRMNTERVRDLEQERKVSAKAIEETFNQTQHQIEKTNQANEAMLFDKQQFQDQRLMKNAEELKQSHQDEIDKFRTQIKAQSDLDAAYKHEKGQGTYEAIRDYEKEGKLREGLIGLRYENEIEKLKKDRDDATELAAMHSTKNMQEKEASFEKFINRQNLDAIENQKNLEKKYELVEMRNAGQMAKERKNFETARDTALTEAEKQKSTALENQALAYKASIEREAGNRSAERRALEVRVHKAPDTANPAKDILPPGVEEQLRKSVIDDYAKSLAAEQERTQRALGSLKDSYGYKIQNMLFDRESREAEIQRDSVATQNAERAQFLKYAQDIEYTKGTALRNKEISQLREIDNITNNYASMLERQHREYEEILSTHKNDSVARLHAVRETADFNAKMAQRAFNSKQNEIVHEYDRKMSDQKKEYEAIIEELKGDANQKIRESDRRNQLALDDQARIYEQKIAQFEYQQKEREQLVSQNYQDQLEKMRRSNALLQQKKS